MTSGVERSSSGQDDCGGSCNSQLCTSYLLGLLACILVVGGVLLAFHRWDYMWLAVSAVGVLLILVGAALHYCGSSRNARRKRASRLDLGHSEQLLPSAPTLSSTYSVSQLSLNMLPPYFPAYDTMSIATQPDGSISASQIMQINGQSFLLLPLTDGMAETQSITNRLSIQLVQTPLEQPSMFNNKMQTTNSIQPSNFPTQVTAPVNQPYSYPLQVGLPPVKDITATSEMQRSEEVLRDYVPEIESDYESPTYLSLEPTYESLEPVTEPVSTAEEQSEDSGLSVEAPVEPVPNPEVQETTNVPIAVPVLPEEDTSSAVDCEPTGIVNCPLPVPEDEPSEARNRESAMECNRALEELYIPNPSPRSITPEPDHMSSPPPSYDEVAHIAMGAYGVAYGTI